MRNLLRMSVIAALVAVPLSAVAQIPTIGTVEPNCDGMTRDILANGGEVYAIKADGGANNDWQSDMTAKGGGTVGLITGDVGGPTYQVLGGNFTRPEAPTNVVGVFVTFPNGELHFDSGDLSTGFNFMDSASVQTVGNSFTGALTLPGDTTAYQVDFGAGAVDFPSVGSTGGTGQAINYAFSPFPELANDATPGTCDTGGELGDPGTSDPVGGFIRGYNVYRMVDSGGGAPDAATLGAMTNWVGFLPMTFDFSTADTLPAAPGTLAPTDANPLGDQAGLQNLDGAPWTGDEVLLFQDGAAAPDGVAAPAPPDPTLSYWYAVQPVLRGSVADFANVSLAKGPTQDHTADLTGDGTADWVDLDLDGSPDFYSPNENVGIPGLGLTNGGAPLLSPVAWSDPTRLPATEYLGLDVEMGRRGVSLSLSTGLEAGNVLGYNVFRLVGDAREQVNDSLITARGGNGSTYELTDERFSGRRARDLSYEVEVLYNDGTPARVVGPFAAESVARDSGRRSR